MVFDTMPSIGKASSTIEKEIPGIGFIWPIKELAILVESTTLTLWASFLVRG
jgi:hypothetical protein